MMNKLPRYELISDESYDEEQPGAYEPDKVTNADSAAGFDMDDFLEAHIEQQLSAVYHSLKSEPIPARFLDILKQIKPEDEGE